MGRYFTREELEANGIWARSEQEDRDVAWRMGASEEELEEEDRKRLADIKVRGKRCPQVYSVQMCHEEYASMIRGLVVKYFKVWGTENQDDRVQDVFLRLTETKHLRKYKPLLVYPAKSPPLPIIGEEESFESHEQKLSARLVECADLEGKYGVAHPAFQTHLYTVAQTACVNFLDRRSRDVVANSLSLSVSYGDDERSTLLDCIFDKKENLESAMFNEVLDKFELYLVQQYSTRKGTDGNLVDWWGPDLPMQSFRVHTVVTPAVCVTDGVEMVYGEKGVLVPKVVGTPVMDAEGSLEWESTGETVRRSFAQVLRLMRDGFRQVEIAHILGVSPGSPGNWVSRIRQDFVVFLKKHGLFDDFARGYA